MSSSISAPVKVLVTAFSQMNLFFSLSALLTISSTVLLAVSCPAVRAAETAVKPLTGAVEEQDVKPLTGAVEDNELKAKTKHKLTAEDYRKMEFGITGLISLKSFFSKNYTVCDLVDGCPAQSAGMRPGDVVIQANDHVFTRQDGQKEYWHTMDGKAGTPVDVVVRRGRKTLTFHLIRMNIEDIPNRGIRRMFERMLRKLGSSADMSQFDSLPN